MYVRGSKSDYDGWNSILGNKGWGWSDLMPYFRKHQTLDLPRRDITGVEHMPHKQVDEVHGMDGPIHTSFNDYRMPMEEEFIKACYEATGKENTLKDAWGGDHYGFYSSLGSIDRTNDKGNRSYAATGYLRPNLGRKNLKVLTEALATRVILDTKLSQDPVATGVEFMHGGKTYKAMARQEVVLSAGVIQTPQLLELSGIGDPQVLKTAGVECVVKNPAVGANFQDHVLGGMVFECAEGIRSLDSLHQEEYGQQHLQTYESERTGPYGSPGMCMGFVSYSSIVTPDELSSTIQKIKSSTDHKTALEKKQEDLIVQQLRDPTFANLQVFLIPANMDLTSGGDQTLVLGPPPKGKNRVALLMCLEHPLSRGSVHIQSLDPTKQPRIDPGYFSHPADPTILAAGLKWMDQVSRSHHLKEQLGERVQPRPDEDLSSPSAREQVLRNYISTQYHLIGTAALGEVVDEKLRVKGVKHLRVVDASVFPAHVSGNIMASAYAVAEKGADIIKET